MLRITERRIARLLSLSSLPVALLLWCAPDALGQKTATAAANRAPATAADDDKNQPPYHEYKGIRIGMTADEARKKLGEPADKGDKQDFYSFADGNEMAQIFYDAEKKVAAVSVIYMGGGGGIPTAKAVLGDEIEAKPDGSSYRKVDYPKAGFWVAYSRTAGDSPMVTVTMQKKP
jgi:hypothetical protein